MDSVHFNRSHFTRSTQKTKLFPTFYTIATLFSFSAMLKYALGVGPSAWESALNWEPLTLDPREVGQRTLVLSPFD